MRMKKGGRYDATGLVEGQFEPGSRGRVLKNLAGIKSRRKMNEVESQAYVHAIAELTKTLRANTPIYRCRCLQDSSGLAWADLSVGRTVSKRESDEGRFYVCGGSTHQPAHGGICKGAVSSIHTVWRWLQGAHGSGAGHRSRRAGADSSLPRWQWSWSTPTGDADGAAGRATDVRFHRN